jgi:dynein heavy chain
MQTKQCNPT